MRSAFFSVLNLKANLRNVCHSAKTFAVQPVSHIVGMRGTVGLKPIAQPARGPTLCTGLRPPAQHHGSGRTLWDASLMPGFRGPAAPSAMGPTKARLRRRTARKRAILRQYNSISRLPRRGWMASLPGAEESAGTGVCLGLRAIVTQLAGTRSGGRCRRTAPGGRAAWGHGEMVASPDPRL